MKSPPSSRRTAGGLPGPAGSPTREVFLVSEDAGRSWKDSSSGFPDGAWITGFASSGATLYAGTFGDGVFRSQSGGSHWRSVNSGFPAHPGVDICGLVASRTDVYAGTHEHGIFVLREGNSGWERVIDGLPPEAHLMSLAANGDSVFAGMQDCGVYILKRGRAARTACEAGLPGQVTVGSLAACGAYRRRRHETRVVPIGRWRRDLDGCRARAPGGKNQ
ncbi:MAG: hypothetical protein MZU84_09450 [Sphingobacterium sp.]|nr:hypothetical protein [Sphingobacterium sp.]